MSLAVILGSSRGLGLALARAHLATSALDVVCASRTPDAAREAILQGMDAGAARRLTTLAVDVTDERSIEEAAKQCREMGELRSLWNVAGVLTVEKALQHVEYEEMLRQFKINTFGPLLAYKHFAPLLPRRLPEPKPGTDDAGAAVAPRGLCVLASLSARVGSTGDNRKGGWYSYRASKAAQNSITRTAALELSMRSTPAITIALHPGTVRTELSADFTGGPGGKPGRAKPKGEFEADEAAANLLRVVRGLTRDDSGGFRDWAGETVPY